MVIGSRIRERDKNNEEYYVGDYLAEYKINQKKDNLVQDKKAAVF